MEIANVYVLAALFFEQDSGGRECAVPIGRDSARTVDKGICNLRLNARCDIALRASFRCRTLPVLTPTTSTGQCVKVKGKALDDVLFRIIERIVECLFVQAHVSAHASHIGLA